MIVRSINPSMMRWFDMAENSDQEMTTENIKDEYRKEKNPIPADFEI